MVYTESCEGGCAMRTVHELSRLAGVSVRTLHHYDAIGLLRPSGTTASGYRLYDDAAASRLQTILLLRELRFPLREIKEILERPGYDAREALTQQIALLELQKARTERLLALARRLEKGETVMDFSAFDKSEQARLSAEAKERWGDTEAYRAYTAKELSEEETKTASEALLRLLALVAEDRALDPAEPVVQERVRAVQEHITANFYPCPKEMLVTLGVLYTQDERFRETIDSRGGDGAAAYIARAIEVYCR